MRRKWAMNCFQQASLLLQPYESKVSRNRILRKIEKSERILGIRNILWASKHLVHSPVIRAHGNRTFGGQQLLLQGEANCKSISALPEKFSDGYVLSWGMLGGAFPWETISQ